MAFKIIPKYIASEFIHYFLLFLCSFVLMTMVGNFFGNLGYIYGFKQVILSDVLKICLITVISKQTLKIRNFI